jgi:hypothetical protein
VILSAGLLLLNVLHLTISSHLLLLLLLFAGSWQQP